MSFDNIPPELKAIPQWIVWRYEQHSDPNHKPVKVPYNARTGFKADVTNPDDFSSFDCVILCDLSSTKPVVAKNTGAISSFSGLGFCFTLDDDYCGIDLDTVETIELQERQKKIFNDFDSYSELSPSGKGLHIIVKGTVPRGRRREDIEIYSDSRYFTFTGNVYDGKYQINSRQEYLTQLWDQMGGPAYIYDYGVDQEEKEPDDVILERAISAVNGEKFKALHNGQWSDSYKSQSEADFAYIDILAFYTQNKAQIRRLYARSVLGKQPKDNYEHRSDRKQYVEYMVAKSFDRQLPKIDLDGLKIRFENEQAAIYVKPVPPAIDDFGFPPGLVGWVADYIYNNSPTPVKEIALAGAIGFVAGICGRAYNISGTGLNQYILLIAQTGAGKEAMANGISKITEAIKTIVPTSVDFRGPGEIVSSAGLLRVLEKTPCFFSILGEFGLLLQQLSNQRNPMGRGILKLLLQLYNRSGISDLLDSAAYSDRTKNIPNILAPSVTILAETAPVRFYEALDESMILDGLLPRFLIFEYKGPNPYFIKKAREPVPFYIVENLANLIGICSSRQALNTVQNVELEPDAEQLFDKFSHWATDETNWAQNNITRYLWNRAHMKALKFAALISVGINPINPIVDLTIAEKCIDIIVEQIKNLIERFEKEEVGQQLNSENRQMKRLCLMIKNYVNEPFDKWKMYGALEKQHYDKVVPISVLQRKLVSDAAFKNDKIGATNAIQKQLKNLFDNEDISEIPKTQLKHKYGTAGKAFIIVNPQRFLSEQA